MSKREKTVDALIEATRQLGRAIELLATELQQQQSTDEIPEWLPTEQAWKALSLPSAEALRRKVRKGVFDIGTHYRLANHDPYATKQRYEFHIDRCKQRLATPPRKWAKPK